MAARDRQDLARSKARQGWTSSTSGCGLSQIDLRDDSDEFVALVEMNHRGWVLDHVQLNLDLFALNNSAPDARQVSRHIRRLRGVTGNRGPRPSSRRTAGSAR